jgi:hypothetical protein
MAIFEFADQIDNKKKCFGKKLCEFDVFLREELKLVKKGYYTEIGVALGTSFRVSLGTVFENVFLFLSIGISMYICIGLVFGLLIGEKMDDKAEKEGRVLVV